ncbi:hypothetical protein [Paenibacillus sedimenti]|uniref:Uncharacterized protein n=1 Tax=Paenibacillus sedimenti TaxID=2770274 RepID=A0A926KVD1_9BACL|nr:hypothetical protein [Paenibacillus sedimenti]MBD0383866.1 hypothetical protein [Paenibacillus sedimenti]
MRVIIVGMHQIPTFIPFTVHASSDFFANLICDIIENLFIYGKCVVRILIYDFIMTVLTAKALHSVMNLLMAV